MKEKKKEEKANPNEFKLKDGGKITVQTMPKDEATDLALDLMAMAGEGAGELLGAIANSVGSIVMLAKGFPLHLQVIDGAAAGRGLASLARAIKENGGSAWMSRWLQGVTYVTSKGEHILLGANDEAPGFHDERVSKGTLITAVKCSILANCADFFDMSGQQVLGPLAGLMDLTQEGLSLLRGLSDELKNSASNLGTTESPGDGASPSETSKIGASPT